MRAAVFESVGGDVRVRSLPVPVCPPDGVAELVRATGVCRSDWHEHGI